MCPNTVHLKVNQHHHDWVIPHWGMPGFPLIPCPVAPQLSLVFLAAAGHHAFFENRFNHGIMKIS
jgi:hypothetical protein